MSRLSVQLEDQKAQINQLTVAAAQEAEDRQRLEAALADRQVPTFPCAPGCRHMSCWIV